MYENRPHPDIDYFNSRVHQYRQERTIFKVKVYAVAIFFILISLGHWLPLQFSCQYQKYVVNHFFISIIGLSVALVTVTALIFIEALRFSLFIGWFLAFLVVFGITWGLSRGMLAISLFIYGHTVVGSLVFFLFCIGLGGAISHDLTLDIVALFVSAIFVFLVSIYVLFLHMAHTYPYMLYVFCVFLIIIVIMFLLYHVQTIAGGHYAEMRLKDYLLGSLLIYLDYVVILMAVSYLAEAIAEGQASQLMKYTTELDCNSRNVATKSYNYISRWLE